MCGSHVVRYPTHRGTMQGQFNVRSALQTAGSVLAFYSVQVSLFARLLSPAAFSEARHMLIIKMIVAPKSNLVHRIFLLSQSVLMVDFSL